MTADGGGETGAWLIAMARDAVAQRRGSGWIPSGEGAGRVPAGDVVAALARLGDPEREVLVLRLLLGHSLGHAAHLSGYSRRAVMELQLSACLAIGELTGGGAGGGGLGTPLTTILEPTTSSTVRGPLAPPTAPRASTASAPRPPPRRRP